MSGKVDPLKDLKDSVEVLGRVTKEPVKVEMWVRTLREELADLERWLATPTTEIQRPPVPVKLKPCWQWANQVYEWGLANLPASQHNYRDIHAAALIAQTGEGGKVPRVRLPKRYQTFAEFVRRYRETRQLDSHRRLRRSGAA